jgi:hypothetical protein
MGVALIPSFAVRPARSIIREKPGADSGAPRLDTLRRTSVTLVARLQQAGLIRYSRGRIQITDFPGLNEAACECYGTAKAQYDQLLNNDRDTCAAA